MFGFLNSEVLDNLLDNKELPLLQSSMTTHPLPPEVGQQVREQLEVVLKSPLAYGIKTDMEKVTYLNRGMFEQLTSCLWCIIMCDDNYRPIL